MIPFPFTFFASLEPFLLDYTGMYESFDEYVNGESRFLFKSGYVFENGTNYPQTGYATGVTFDAAAYWIDSYDDYIAPEYRTIFSGRYSGVFDPFPALPWVSGLSFLPYPFFTEPFEQYVTGVLTGYFSNYTGLNSNQSVLPWATGVAINYIRGFFDDFDQYTGNANQSGFTGWYTGFTYSVTEQLGGQPSGTALWGYIERMVSGGVQLPFEFPNYGDSPPTIISGSGMMITGGWDRVSDTHFGFLNRPWAMYVNNNRYFQIYKQPMIISDFTIEIAVKRTGWADASSRIIDHDGRSGFFLGRNTNTDFLRAGSTGGFFNCDVPLSDNLWTHVAFVKSGNLGVFYMSGMRRNSSAQPPNLAINNRHDFYIGRTKIENDANQFQGYFDEVRIWNYGRTDTEIAAGASGTINPYQPGLIAYFSTESL